jgi:hypothetical protein
VGLNQKWSQTRSWTQNLKLGSNRNSCLFFNTEMSTDEAKLLKKTILFVSSRPFLLSTFLFFCYLPTLFCCLPQLPRTTDARRGICLHCSAENPLPLPNV